MNKKIILDTQFDTLQFGRRIASVLPKGGFVALYGDLGTGKSVIARGIADHLGVQNVASPTFTIMQRYDTHPVLYHIDAYRLADSNELFDVGFEECLRDGALVVIEWADIVSDALPVKRLDIHLTGSGTEPRTACLDCDERLICKEQFQTL